MPRFNGTGPFGHGPATGRGMGYCTGFRGWGRRMGRGFSTFGQFRGPMNMAYIPQTAPTVSKEEQLQMMEAEINAQEAVLDSMRKHVEQLRNEP